MPKAKSIPRDPDLLFSVKLDGHIGLNDVLLIYEEGRRERITRQQFEQRIKKEEGFTGVREPNELKKPNSKRSGTSGNVKHKQDHVKRPAPTKQLSFGKVKP